MFREQMKRALKIWTVIIMLLLNNALVQPTTTAMTAGTSPLEGSLKITPSNQTVLQKIIVGDEKKSETLLNEKQESNNSTDSPKQVGGIEIQEPAIGADSEERISEKIRVDTKPVTSSTTATDSSFHETTNITETESSQDDGSRDLHKIILDNENLSKQSKSKNKPVFLETLKEGIKHNPKKSGSIYIPEIEENKNHVITVNEPRHEKLTTPKSKSTDSLEDFDIDPSKYEENSEIKSEGPLEEISLANDTDVNYKTPRDPHLKNESNVIPETEDVVDGFLGPKHEVEIVKNVTNFPLIKSLQDPIKEKGGALDPDGSVAAGKRRSLKEQIEKNSTKSHHEDNGHSKSLINDVDLLKIDKIKKDIISDGILPKKLVPRIEFSRNSSFPSGDVTNIDNYPDRDKDPEEEEPTETSVTSEMRNSNGTDSSSSRARTISFSGMNNFFPDKVESRVVNPNHDSGTKKPLFSGKETEQKPHPYLKANTKKSVEGVFKTTDSLTNTVKSIKEPVAYRNTIERRGSEQKVVITEPSLVLENSIHQFKPTYFKRSGNFTRTNFTLSDFEPRNTTLSDINQRDSISTGRTVLLDHISRITPDEITTQEGTGIEHKTSGEPKIDLSGNGITEVNPKNSSSKDSEESVSNSSVELIKEVPIDEESRQITKLGSGELGVTETDQSPVMTSSGTHQEATEVNTTPETRRALHTSTNSETKITLEVNTDPDKTSTSSKMEDPEKNASKRTEKPDVSSGTSEFLGPSESSKAESEIRDVKLQSSDNASEISMGHSFNRSDRRTDSLDSDNQTLATTTKTSLVTPEKKPLQETRVLVPSRSESTTPLSTESPKGTTIEYEFVKLKETPNLEEESSYSMPKTERPSISDSGTTVSFSGNGSREPATDTNRTTASVFNDDVANQSDHTGSESSKSSSAEVTTQSDGTWKLFTSTERTDRDNSTLPTFETTQSGDIDDYSTLTRLEPEKSTKVNFSTTNSGVSSSGEILGDTTTKSATETVPMDTTTTWTTTWASTPGLVSENTKNTDLKPTTAISTGGKTPFALDDIKVLVRIIFEGAWSDICPRLQLIKESLANLLTSNTNRVVSSEQVILYQTQCNGGVISKNPSPETPSTSVLIYVVDENGDFDESMTRILPSLYKASTITLPLSIHNVLLVQETDSANAIAVVVVSSVAFICLVLLAGLLFIMRKRQTRFNYGERCRPVSLDAYSLDSVSAYNSVRRKGAARISKRSYGNPTFEDSSTIPSHPLNFAGLSVFCNDDNAIAEEFAGIPQISGKIDELPQGAEVKNRYANVIPLPETRVSLQKINDDPLTEYINANYVRGLKNAMKYYIACQAPTESTVTDFWRMIWEQQSKVIIMLTDLVENGVEKCSEYIPPSEVTDCHRLYGDYQVTLKKRETKEKYAISTLHLKNLENNTFREVSHIWYLWPPSGMPDSASLIAVLLEARALQRGGPGPIVVHCSPGTGRTGTLIALDLGIRQYEITRTVDVPRVVYTIRRDRAGAVQTKEQYTFIYKALYLYATKLSGGVLEST